MINPVFAVQKYRNLSIRNKIFLSYILILIIIFVIVIAFNGVQVSKETREKTEYTAEQALLQTSSFIEFKTSATKNILNITALNSTLQDILSQETELYRNNVGLWLINTQKIEEVFFTTSYNPDFMAVKLYLESGLTDLFTNEQYNSMKDYQDESWFKVINPGTNKVYWFVESSFADVEQPTLIAMKKIPSKTNLNDSIGFLRIDIDRNIIIDLLEQGLTTEDSMSFLISPTEIICESENMQFLDESLQNRIIDYIRNTDAADPVWKNFRSVKGDMLVVHKRLSNTDWKLVTLIPQKDINSQIRDAIIKLIFTLFLIIPITLPIAYLVSKSITNRISLLTEQIQKVGIKHLDLKIDPDSHDEVGILTTKFNLMLDRISTLLEEKFDLGQELKSIELKALQAQINPHFLYNTLDQLYWLGVKHDVKEISDLVLSFSKFYKLSLSKGKSEVTIQNEIEHIQTYINIQNFRFDNSFKLEIEVGEEYTDILIPKISLQPIIENSIIHGIQESDNEKGTISIYTETLEDNLLLKIKDDGVGMTKDQLSGLFEEKKDYDSLHGFGLKNIDSRYKLLFGPDYGITIESELNEGTSVIIKIPIKRKPRL